MSAPQSAHTSASATGTKGVQASTQATVREQPTKYVEGEARDSVTVQSQLATSTVAGDVTSRSNIGQVVTDLGAAHNAHSGWVEAETNKISQWGQNEIQRILAQTKGMEQQLIKQAQEKQIALDNSHKGELEKLVQQLDLRKAAELKELEDALQRQVQGVLTTSKQDINRIETEMNNKKMELLKQSQLRSAKEIDQLSNLVVETKLVPSQTRTVIETNTNTGNVIAVATGGSIATGHAESAVIASQKIEAVPNAGRLHQETDVKTGDMIRDRDQRKVGEGAIVSTMTEVTEQSRGQGYTQGAGAGPVGGAGQHRIQGDNLYHQPNQQQFNNLPATSQISRGPVNSGVSHSQASGVDNDIHSGATQRTAGPLPTDAGREAGSNAGPIYSKHDGQSDAYSNVDKAKDAAFDAKRMHDAHNSKPVDAAYGKHSSTDAHHGGGLLSKVKNALTGHHGSEPTSTDASRRY